MDKNIAAILREDAKTISVSFPDESGFASDRHYTYITHIDMQVGDYVVVPTGKSEVWKICKVEKIHDELQIEPNSETKYKWVIDVINVKAAMENIERNKEIENVLAQTYHRNARQAYAQQFLSGADPKVLALVKGDKS
jgi:hypothetical protein